jgi:hypothetical protein
LFYCGDKLAFEEFFVHLARVKILVLGMVTKLFTHPLI